MSRRGDRRNQLRNNLRTVAIVSLGCLAVVPVLAAEEGPAGGAVYIVTFEEAPLSTYDGGLPGLQATNPRARGERRLDPRSDASRAYLQFLDQRHESYVAAMSQRIGRAPRVIFDYRGASNGVALRVTPEEAAKLRSIPGVVRVEPDRAFEIGTDRGPWFVGADAVWDGSVLPGAGTQGEGVTIGIIDTGINQVHPSFSDAPLDGHSFTNPLGSGTYLGWCQPGHPDYDPGYVCNDKLIGMYDFVDVLGSESDGPIDGDGHGSHVASTASGNALDYNGDTLPDISGVAPHANLIAYDSCQGTSCPLSATSAAVDQAVLDAVVDVLNYSIHGGNAPYNPGNIENVMLGAVNAGIVVVSIAGNFGPAAGTVRHRGPWVLTVANSSHDRVGVENSLVDMSGGMTAPPADITGQSRTLGYGPAPIVYARNFSNGDTHPELCTLPFPPGTWSGEIVLCDQEGGWMMTMMLAQNVLAGGAGAVVLARTPGEDEILARAHVLPAIHIDVDEGDALRAWLSSGSGHTATLTDSVTVLDPASGDVMEEFSGRGPNPAFDVLKPDVSAPGTAIYAAVSGDFYDVEGLPPFEGPEFAWAWGTSQASPHVAGAAALIRSVHPDWTPPEIQSALMTTAVTSLRKEDLVTPADPFDMGAGRVDVSLAVQAGLLLHETTENFQAANPDLGGDPKTLNLASLTDSLCVGSCSWTRVFENALDTTETWTPSGSGPAWMSFEFTPPGFTLAAGATQTLTIDLHVDVGAPAESWEFGEVVLTPNGGGVPETRLPVSVMTFPAAGTVPDGGAVPGEPLTLAKAPIFGEVLQWGSSCAVTDTSFDVYVGSLGDFASHSQHTCSTPGPTLDVNLPDDSYVLVVPRNDLVEGSYGTDSAGIQRPAAATACLADQALACE